MLRLVLISKNPVTAAKLASAIEGSAVFQLVSKYSPAEGGISILRSLNISEPEVILLDLEDWRSVSAFAGQLTDQLTQSVVIGLHEAAWTRADRELFEESGIRDLVRDVSSVAELEEAAYEALHREHPLRNRNILAFLPAKAGGGCSTVALNTAAALASSGKKVLLMECDRRSGVLSILLNVENHRGLPEILEDLDNITPLVWRDHIVDEAGVHLLLANPGKRSFLPSWSHYYRLLHAVQNQYDFILADLPEVINTATAEIVRSSREVMVVCEPEVASMKLASLRCGELESCGIASDKIHIVLNRWEKDRFPLQKGEAILGRSVFAALANDYKQITNAAMESRIVSDNSRFAESCRALAAKLNEGTEAQQPKTKFSFLQKLGRMAS